MFDSEITAKDLIAQLQSEVDVAYDIPDATYLLWLNALEQMLYTEFIKEQGETTASPTENNVIELASLAIGDDENVVRFEDVYTVYADDVQLIKTTLNSGALFPDCYYKTGGNLGYRCPMETEALKIIYFLKPALKKEENYTDLNVMVPIEFIDLVKAKLRAEAYKLMNEDALAAKWVNDYNVLLENFTVWLTSKEPQFGM